MTNNECNHLHVKITEIVIELVNKFNLDYCFCETSSEWRIIMGDYPKGIVIWLSDNGRINYSCDLAYHTLPYVEPTKDKPDSPFKPDPPRISTIEDLKEKLTKRIENQLVK